MVVKGITKRWLLNSLGVILILIIALVFSLSSVSYTHLTLPTTPYV